MKVYKSRTTSIQTVLFPRNAWDRKTARAWLARNKFKSSQLDATEDYLRYRQESPDQFQPKSFRTITLKKGTKPVKAVIGRPWVIVSNPRCVLFDTIHRDWRLHKRKHALYARLARQKGTGTYSVEKAKRAFRSLVTEAARVYRRQHKVKPKLSVVFPENRISKGVEALVKEFNSYWKKGQLDQYLPRKAWGKRQEK